MVVLYGQFMMHGQRNIKLKEVKVLGGLLPSWPEPIYHPSDTITLCRCSVNVISLQQTQFSTGYLVKKIC